MFSILAPKIFSFAFNIVKKFLDEYTISKINIYKHNQSKWLPAILERVDASYLPKYYGGELTDSDGNIKCLEKIHWGGKIPKSFYITEEDSYNSTSSYQTVYVKKGSKLKLNFDVEDSGVFLKWDFKTHNHDIKFGVRALNNKTGEKFNEVDLKRIEASESEETGFITCLANHKCELTSFQSLLVTYYHSIALQTPSCSTTATAISRVKSLPTRWS